MKITIAYHGHCFDGMASAALLTRFLRREAGETGATFAYRGLDHQPGGSHVPESVLDGDLNAVVDFRYSTSPKLDWWFDHHLTGLVSDEERAHLAADSTGHKFFDAQCGSCCRLIADVTRTRFGFEAPELDELVRWAHVIDTATFETAESAVWLPDPALQLMAVVERHGDDKFLAPRIAALAEGATLEELTNDADVRARLAPIVAERDRDIERVRAAGRVEDGVVRIDLVESGDERYGKFIPYMLFPEARYVVVLSRGARRTKVSVGFNPWSKVPRAHDISALCAKHGGGGHAVVGAVSLGPDELDRGRIVAKDIADALSRDPVIPIDPAP
ncbi:MAG: phosphoesterase [Deltaproteobacteria bacterium]|nr:phosphoesterase [Deltaproteobacteria bacterium]